MAGSKILFNFCTFLWGSQIVIQLRKLTVNFRRERSATCLTGELEWKKERVNGKEYVE